jgi:hypothetical protein
MVEANNKIQLIILIKNSTKAVRFSTVPSNFSARSLAFITAVPLVVAPLAVTIVVDDHFGTGGPSERTLGDIDFPSLPVIVIVSPKRRFMPVRRYT